MIHLVGICGRKGSGKTTLAEALSQFLKEDPRTTEVRILYFADELRNHLSILDPLVAPGQSSEEVRWNEAVAQYGYDEAKRIFPEMRRLMQVYGTEIVRDRVGHNYWMERVRTQVEDAIEVTHSAENLVFLIPDLRFLNELIMFVDLDECYSKKYFTTQVVQLRAVDEDTSDSHASEEPLSLEGLDITHHLMQNDKTERFFAEARGIGRDILRQYV